MTGPERVLAVAGLVMLLLFLVVAFGLNERVSRLRSDLKQRGVL